MCRVLPASVQECVWACSVLWLSLLAMCSAGPTPTPPRPTPPPLTRWYVLRASNVVCSLCVCTVYTKVKGKGSPCSSTECRLPELIPVLGSEPSGDVSHKPGGRLPLLSTRPAVTLATLKWAASNLLPVSQLYTMSRKNDTDVACYNSDIHQPILMILCKSLAERVCHQTMIYFPPTLTNVSALPGETWTREIRMQMSCVIAHLANGVSRCHGADFLQAEDPSCCPVISIKRLKLTESVV